VYALLAVVGSYLAPLLVTRARRAAGSGAYFTAWSILFSILALVERRRLTPACSLYFALIGFDVAFASSIPAAAVATAVTYQLVSSGILEHRGRLLDPSPRPDSSLSRPRTAGALFYFTRSVRAAARESRALDALAGARQRAGRNSGCISWRESLPSGRAPGALLVSTYASVVGVVLFFELVPDGDALAGARDSVRRRGGAARDPGPLGPRAVPVVAVSAVMFCYELGLVESPVRYAESPGLDASVSLRGRHGPRLSLFPGAPAGHSASSCMQAM
jgi:hypothetical protein